jgi:hypothetical protein
MNNKKASEWHDKFRDQIEDIYTREEPTQEVVFGAMGALSDCLVKLAVKCFGKQIGRDAVTVAINKSLLEMDEKL